MKKLFISLAVAASAFCSHAQNIFDNPDNHAYFGARLSYELACPGDVDIDGFASKIDALGNSSGFSVGAIYNLPVWKNLYFEPGASIYYNTYSINKSMLSLISEETFESASVRQWGIRIPLHIGYHFDFTPDIRVAVFTGPEFNVSFKGNVHMGIDKYNVTGPAFGDEGYFNRADIKWRFGVGATLFDHYYIALSGAAGMCDLMRDDIVFDDANGLSRTPNLKMRSNLFNLTLGYNF